MRLHSVRVLPALLLAVLTACGGGDGPTQQTGPVTLTFSTDVIGGDTVKGFVIIDGVDTVDLPYGTRTNFPRGEHTFEAHLDIDYLPAVATVNVNPRGNIHVQPIRQAGTCRRWADDRDFCLRRNFVSWSGSQRVLCPVNDFGDFCSFYAAGDQVGMSWPNDSSANEYIGHAKLLIGAIMGANSPAGAEGDTIATALFDPGDYSPRVRLHHIPGDSSRWQAEVWTDARHIPLFPNTQGTLGPTDRVNNNLGLSVRTTYYLPAAYRNALFVRFDIANISAEPDYRRVHPEEPATGHTVNQVFLAPMFDPGIGFVPNSAAGEEEAIDDNVTMFPAENLIVAYDQRFSVPTFGRGYATKPGLVGVQLLAAPSGTTARGILLTRTNALQYQPAAREDTTYAIIAGGRAAPLPSACVVRTEALVCSPEGAHDPKMGWSVGPIPSIAPGTSVSLTIAILVAPPTPGTFTSGTDVRPENNNLASTTRAIYTIGERLRLLADSTRTVTVNGTPGR